MWHEYWLLILAAILIIPLVCVAMFGLWLRRRSDVDLEKGTKCWEAFIKLISAVTIVVSGAMVFGKYIDQQESVEKNRVEQQERELDLKKAEFLRQKLQFDTERHQRRRVLFDEAKVIVARIANTPSPDKGSISRFEEMYHAALIGIEKLHGPVEAAMVKFRKKLRGLPGSLEDSLEQLSLQLSTACETEMKASEESLIKQHEQILQLLATKTK